MELGFREIQKLNGLLYFVTNDIDGLEVTFVDGRYREPIAHKKVVEKATGNTLRLYSTQLSRATVEFKTGDVTKILKIEHGRLEWM